MKRIYCIVFLLIFSTRISSCSFFNSFHEAAVCGFFAIPDIGYRDLKGGRYQIQEIEQDSYGRLLFEISMESVVTLEPITALAVMQKYDSKYVYYYEDIAYMLHSFEDVDIEALKAQNDWEKPLDKTKLSRRRSSVSLDSVINIFPAYNYVDIWNDCNKAIEGQITSMSGDYASVVYIDGDDAGHELYYFMVEQEHGEKAYFAIVGPNSEIAFLQIMDKTIDREALSTFKQENGWQYGYTQ